jgi:hypothetical protein
MEGQGVVNYSVDKPSYAITTETTEFDDELIKRGIITFEESMMRKGASQDEAMRLKELKEGTTEAIVDTDDDAFLEQYRLKRLQELKKAHQYGQVLLISRQDWTREVNDASHKTWVIITLTSSDMERTGCMESTVASLATKYDDLKFVAIPHQQAIANWPEEHLPTLFLYRHGKMQHQLVSLPTDINADQLEWTLAQLGVLETDLEVEPRSNSSNNNVSTGSYRGTTFGGTGSQLKTRELGNDDDYDEVD